MPSRDLPKPVPADDGGESMSSPVPVAEYHDDVDGGDAPYGVLDSVARALHLAQSDTQATVDAVVREAIRVQQVAEQAGILLIERGRPRTKSTIGEAPEVLDRWQEKALEGPCLDAARTQCIVEIANVADDSRWPGYARLAMRLEVCSMLCVPLIVDGRTLGSLTLYASRPHVFTEAHQLLTTTYATLAALALTNSKHQAQLAEALLNRDVIGQAKGILMERHKITADMAFDMLSKESQSRNIRLAKLAADFVQTGAFDF